MSKDDGGAAFPVPESTRQYTPQGMTLRDYFAAAMLQGLLAGKGLEALENVRKNTPAEVAIAKCCYQQADAMLAERSK